MEKRFLLAMTAPEHITISLSSIRDTIFRETGEVSALALDPLIPAGWYSSMQDKKLFMNISTPAPPFKLLYPETHEKGIYFRVNNEQIFDTLRRIASAEPPPGQMPEPFPGFFLCESADPEIRKTITELTALKIKTDTFVWKGITLKMLEVVIRESQPWFNNLDWNGMWEINPG